MNYELKFEAAVLFEGRHGVLSPTAWAKRMSVARPRARRLALGYILSPTAWADHIHHIQSRSIRWGGFTG